MGVADGRAVWGCRDSGGGVLPLGPSTTVASGAVYHVGGGGGGEAASRGGPAGLYVGEFA